MIQKTKTSTTKRPVNAGAPRARTWSHKSTSQRNRFAPKDDRTIRRDAPQCDLRRPNWKGKFPCVVRILPNFNYDDPSGPFDPTRLDVESDNAFSDFWRSVPAARQVGLEQQFTFLLFDPRRVLTGEYDISENPYVIFSRAMAKAKKLGEAKVRGKDVMTAKWGTYVDKKLIRYPENLGFCQALIYQNGDELYAKNGLPLGANEKDLPQLLQVSRTAENSFLPLLNERNPDYEGDPSDQGAAYIHGDIVSLTDGKFVAFYDPQTKTDDLIKLGNLNISSSASDEEANEIVANFLQRHTSHGVDPLEEDYKGNGWGAAILDAYKYELGGRMKSCSNDLTARAEIEEAVMKNIMWWDDLLHFPSHDEICMMMAHAFCEEPNLLEYGWTDNPEFFTDEVKGVLRSRSYHAASQAALLNDDQAEEDVPLEDDGTADDVDTFVPPRVARASSTLPKATSYANVDDVSDDDLNDEDTGVGEEMDATEPEEQEEPKPEVKTSTVKPVPKALLERLKKMQGKK